METITKTTPKKVIQTSTEEKGQVVVHCRYDATYNTRIRIWKNTFLICHDTGNRSELLHAEGIAVAPDWSRIKDGQTMFFALFFSSLPRTCKTFTLLEDMPLPLIFKVENIIRNKLDVYHVIIP